MRVKCIHRCRRASSCISALLAAAGGASVWGVAAISSTSFFRFDASHKRRDAKPTPQARFRSRLRKGLVRIVQGFNRIFGHLQVAPVSTGALLSTRPGQLDGAAGAATRRRQEWRRARGRPPPHPRCRSLDRGDDRADAITGSSFGSADAAFMPMSCSRGRVLLDGDPGRGAPAVAERDDAGRRREDRLPMRARPAPQRQRQAQRRAARRHQAVRRLHGGRGPQPGDRGRGVLHPARPERLRQDDDAADGRRVRGDDRGPGADRRRRRRRAAAVQAADQHRLPELRAVPPPERLGQRRLRPPAQEGGQGRGRAARERGARARRAGPRGQPPARPALGRPAAARGAGPGAGQPAQGPAARRAPRRARPEAAQGPAGTAEADPARRRDHVRLRDPRPGGGADDVRPDRGHEPRPDRAGRRPRAGLRAAGDHLRRRLHRRLQPDAGGRQEGRRLGEVELDSGVTVEAEADGFNAGERCHAVVRPEKLEIGAGGQRGPERRGPGRELAVPGHRDPDGRATPRRGAG